MVAAHNLEQINLTSAQLEQLSLDGGVTTSILRQTGQIVSENTIALNTSSIPGANLIANSTSGSVWALQMGSIFEGGLTSLSSQHKASVLSKPLDILRHCVKHQKPLGPYTMRREESIESAMNDLVQFDEPPSMVIDEDAQGEFQEDISCTSILPNLCKEEASELLALDALEDFEKEDSPLGLREILVRKRSIDCMIGCFKQEMD